MQAIGMHHAPDDDSITPSLPSIIRCAGMCCNRITREQWLQTLHG